MPETIDAPADRQLRPGLEKPPHRIAALPVRRGYPVPWFVAWVDGEPEFRLADPEKMPLAVRNKLCWVCGDVLGRNMTFVLGPMCGVNRTSAEPPCHLDCARYSARNCPFLTKPHMVRREDEVTACGVNPAGIMIRRNPGVVLLWSTRYYEIFGDGRGGVLFGVGDPLAVEWYAEGRSATRAEVEASVAGGLPILEAEAAKEEGALATLRTMVARFQSLVPET